MDSISLHPVCFSGKCSWRKLGSISPVSAKKIVPLFCEKIFLEVFGQHCPLLGKKSAPGKKWATLRPAGYRKMSKKLHPIFHGKVLGQKLGSISPFVVKKIVALFSLCQKIFLAKCGQHFTCWVTKLRLETMGSTPPCLLYKGEKKLHPFFPGNALGKNWAAFPLLRNLFFFVFVLCVYCQKNLPPEFGQHVPLLGTKSVPRRKWPAFRPAWYIKVRRNCIQFSRRNVLGKKLGSISEDFPGRIWTAFPPSW